MTLIDNSFLVRITTVDSLDYRYIPITKNSVSLGIKASHDARIALRTHLGGDSNVYEVMLPCNNL